MLQSIGRLLHFKKASPPHFFVEIVINLSNFVNLSKLVNL